MPLFFLAFLLVFLTAPCPGAAQSCPPFRPPTVTILPLANAPRIDTSQPLSALRAMAQTGAPDKFSGARHEIPVGLTAASMKTEINYKIASTIAPGNRLVCSQIADFTFSFGFDDTTVYLARELSSGSCSYRAVMDHEMRHVDTDRNIVLLYAEQFPALLEKAIREVGVVQASSPQQAENAISRSMRRYIEDLTANLSSVRQKQQEKIDTPEEYARLGASCNGQLAHLLERSRRR